MERSRLVIVGGGMAAQHLVERLADVGGLARFDVALLSEETHAPYDRVHLGDVIEGAPPESLALRDASWYETHDVALQLGSEVEAIDLDARVVRAASGAELGYDTLVLATGGRAVVPPAPGLDGPGVVAYRSLDDVVRIGARAEDARRVVVVGGGLLGLEAARSLQQRGCEIDVVEAAPRLLPRQLDVDGAGVLEAQVRALGMGLHIQSRVSAVEGPPGAMQVVLEDGTRLPADLVVVAAGIAPRDSLARKAGIACHPSGGIQVDDALATSDPHVFAIGECVRHRDEVYGFVAPCYAMAKTLADGLAGRDERFEGAVPSASLKVDVLDVVAVGESLAEGPGLGALTWVEEGTYRRIVLREGRIAGAIAVGPNAEFPRLQEAVAENAPVRAWQRRRFSRNGRLWNAGGQRPIDQWADAAVVCTCTGTTCGVLRAAHESGLRTSQALSERTGAGSVCGTCKPLLAELAGETTAAKREGAGALLAAAATLGLAAIAVAAWLGPFQLSTSVVSEAPFDFLWRDVWWKQVSGFTLVGVSAASLLLSLRKRWRRFRLGTFSGFRQLHAGLGVGTIGLLWVHTGFRLGDNLNFVLMACFSGVVVLGAFAAAVTSLEHRLPAPFGSRLRRGWTAAHIFLFGPLPVLAAFHVLAVYFY